MMVARIVAILLLAWVGSLFGCSAIIDDYDFVDCSHDAGICEKLNAGVKGQCRQFECSADGNGCVLRETDGNEDGELHEICDGLDNDCNGFIDEGTTPPDVGEEAPAPDGVDHVSHASVPDGPLIVTLTSPEPGTSRFETVGFAVDRQGFGDILTVSGGQDCRTSPDSCLISQLALSAAPGVLVGAGIQTLGCAFGQLRVTSGPPSSIDLRSGDGSHSGFAIDPDGSCSLSSEDCRGATEPALALLGGVASEPLEGLLVWRAPALAADSTCEAPSAFQLFARRLSFDGFGADAQLRAPTAGLSQRLGEDLARGVPVIAATTAPESEGYFVAYRAEDQVRVLFVPREEGDSVEPSSAEASFAAREVKGVALTVDDDSTQGLALAVLRAGSGDSFSLELIALEASFDEAPHIARRGNVSIPVQGSVAAGPSLRYAPSGFADAGVGRRPGGWLVVWVERRPDDEVLMGARVAEDDLRRLGDPFELAAGAVKEPFIYLKHGGRDDPSSLQCGFLRDEAVRLQQVSCE